MDKRGWEKGKRRKWDQKTVKRIVEIRQELEDDPTEPYWGPTAIEVEYRNEYPNTEVPPIRTIGQILKDLDLTTNQKKGTKRGALRYLHYPEQTIYQKLGDRVLEADFIGPRYIKKTGGNPIHFIGFSSKHDPRIRHYERVKGVTKKAFITNTETFFDRFEQPDVIKVDNASAMRGSVYHERTLSESMSFLLENRVTPVFSAPRTPATQASIEGSNSVFSRKFWNRLKFTSLEDVDEKLKKFNEKTRAYLRYAPPKKESSPGEEFEPKVYFTRQVREKDQGGGFVNIQNEEIELPEEYIRYFVLGEWDLTEGKLRIRFERRREEEGEITTSEIIKEIDFAIHESSRKRCKDLLD